MAARSPARFLAPLALVGFVVALFLIVSHDTSDNGSGGGTRSTQERSGSSPTASATPKKSKGPRFYRIKPGDTPSSIAAKTGVALTTIEQLNPDLDPQALPVGTRIRLRK